MSQEPPPLLRPVPRRPFDLNFTMATPSNTSPPSPETRPTLLEPSSSGTETPGSFSRTRSILNLTSSTLFGIYSPTSLAGEKEDNWGSGAQTPRERVNVEGRENAPFATTAQGSLHKRTQSSSYVAPEPPTHSLISLVSRIFLLFGLGMGYGLLITHLHEDRRLAPIHVEGFIRPRYNFSYLFFWGMAGVGLGSLMPYFDTLFSESSAAVKAPYTSPQARHGTLGKDESDTAKSSLAADWNPVVRSVGAFVGIAFAIRKLPWTSTLQMSATLALVNPVLWYLIDRSKPGFLLSSSVGLVGTTVFLSLNPEMMPAPQRPFSTHLSSAGNTTISGMEALGGLVSKETIECGTWIISVLFCSCVCFGNIGRRLALPGMGKARRDSLR